MDEFALCWNNFQDNIATGFQSLLDRGHLVDLTIAVEGKLIQAHKIVLAICSQYFLEMFQQNPCKHPIIILKDVSYSVMTELLQFMYQGEVNVKHTELQAFMKIAEMLQIKGLTTPHQKMSSPEYHRVGGGRQSPPLSKAGSDTFSPSSEPKNPNGSSIFSLDGAGSSQKRSNDYVADSYPMMYASKKQVKRSASDANESSSGTHDMTNDSMDNMGDEVFMPPIPQISIGERFDLTNVKRENPDLPNSPQQRGFSYDHHGSSGPGGPSYPPMKPNEYGNDLHATNDFNNSKGSHMEIPAVATQQGMKTYWLCKSYRITMCRARCITHQGRVISATGVHNHAPHMKNLPQTESPCSNSNQPPPQPIVISSTCTPVSSTSTVRIVAQNIPPPLPPSSMAQPVPIASPLHHQNQVTVGHLMPPNQMQHMSQPPPPPPTHIHHIVGPQTIATATPVPQQQTAVIHNMMHNVYNQHHLASSIHGLTSIGPILSPMPHQHHVLTNIHAPPSLQITPVINTHVQSPSQRLVQAHEVQPPTSHAETGPMSGHSEQGKRGDEHSGASVETQTQPESAEGGSSSGQQIGIQTIEMANGQQTFKIEHL